MKAPDLSPPPHANSSTDSSGSLSESVIEELRGGYTMSPADLACHLAVTNHSARSIAFNPGEARGDDGLFSHRVQSKGITNQMKSGRCWMFAGLNTIRPQIIQNHKLVEFEFSAIYLQFWDKLEKSNLYLESIIELRDADYLDRDWVAVNTRMMEDGGWWNYLVSLVDKYGVIPKSAMAETHASNHTEALNEVLCRLLQARAIRILDLHADGAALPKLRAEKIEVLAEVYRLLVLHFGEPPTEFDWRYVVEESSSPENKSSSASTENKQMSATERHTPKSFYQKYVGKTLSEYVCLYNDPQNELNRHYSFDRARNIVGKDCMNFINVEASSMKDIAKASILANEPLWFAVNMNLDQSVEHGMMKHRLHDYEALFGLDLSISKANRTRLHAAASGHAMALMGIDLDSKGRPRKWLVENSWGKDKGNQGTWTLHDDWFNDHVYTITVHRRHVPASILKHLDEKPTLLPAWYPGAQGPQFTSSDS